jgi:hypothetical protein
VIVSQRSLKHSSGPRPLSTSTVAVAASGSGQRVIDAWASGLYSVFFPGMTPGRDPDTVALGLLLKRRVHDIVAGWNLEQVGGRLIAIKLGHGNGKLAGARVTMFREHVELKFLGVPIVIGDPDGLPGAAGLCAEGHRPPVAMNFDAVEHTGTQVFELHNRTRGIITRSRLRPVRGRRCGGGIRESALASDVRRGIQIRVQPGLGVVNVDRQECGLSGAGDWHNFATLIMDATSEITRNEGGGLPLEGASILEPLSHLLHSHGRERHTRNGSDEHTPLKAGAADIARS